MLSRSVITKLLVAVAAPLYSATIFAGSPSPTPTAPPPTVTPVTEGVPLSPELSAIMILLLAAVGIWYLLRNKRA